MAAKKWTRLPGDRWTRWKKSHTDGRPGGCTTSFTQQVPPHWYRNMLNRRERRCATRALHRGAAHAGPYIHPREAGWYW